MDILRLILSFLLFGLIAAFGWGLMVYIFSVDLDPNVIAGLIGAIALIFTSVVSVILQKNREQQINI